MELQNQSFYQQSLNFTTKQPISELGSTFSHTKSLYQHINLEIPNIKLELPRQVRKIVPAKPKHTVKKKEMSIEELMLEQGLIIEARRNSKILMNQQIQTLEKDSLNPQNQVEKGLNQQKQNSPAKDLEKQTQQMPIMELENNKQETNKQIPPPKTETQIEQVIFQQNDQIEIVPQQQKKQVSKEEERKEEILKDKIQMEKQELNQEHQSKDIDELQIQSNRQQPKQQIKNQQAQIKQTPVIVATDVPLKQDLGNIQAFLTPVQSNKDTQKQQQIFIQPSSLQQQLNEVVDQTLYNDQGIEISPIKVQKPAKVPFRLAVKQLKIQEDGENKNNENIKSNEIQSIIVEGIKSKDRQSPKASSTEQVKEEKVTKKSFSKLFVKKASKTQTKQSPSNEEMKQKKSGLLKSFFKSMMGSQN